VPKEIEDEARARRYYLVRHGGREVNFSPSALLAAAAGERSSPVATRITMAPGRPRSCSHPRPMSTTRLKPIVSHDSFESQTRLPGVHRELDAEHDERRVSRRPRGGCRAEPNRFVVVAVFFSRRCHLPDLGQRAAADHAHAGAPKTCS
jgi:hypothetical protein